MCHRWQADEWSIDSDQWEFILIVIEITVCCPQSLLFLSLLRPLISPRSSRVRHRVFPGSGFSLVRLSLETKEGLFTVYNVNGFSHYLTYFLTSGWRQLRCPLLVFDWPWCGVPTYSTMFNNICTKLIHNTYNTYNTRPTNKWQMETIFKELYRERYFRRNQIETATERFA